MPDVDHAGTYRGPENAGYQIIVLFPASTIQYSLINFMSILNFNPRKLGCCICSYLWAYYSHRVALGDAVDDAGTKLLPRKCRISTMPVSIRGRKIPGIEYVPFSCLHNTLVNFMSVV